MRLPKEEARIGVGLQGACVVLRLGLVCEYMRPVSVSVVSPILYCQYWVRNLDSSLSLLTVGVVWVCVFCSTLCICTVETLKNQASSDARAKQKSY
jgi:hypothetical protein